MEEELICEVEKNPCLYDKSLPSFKESVKKLDVWNQIGDKLGISGEAAKKKWTHLRDAFQRNERKKKDKRSGDAASTTKTYKYAAVMSFLLPHIHVRETSTNLSSSNREDEADKDGEDESLHGNDSTSDVDMTEKPASPSPPKETPKKPKRQELECAMLDYFRQRSTSFPSTSVDPFFQEIAATIGKLPPIIQSRLKFDIYQMVHKAEIDHLSTL
ncbi:uncharacterized protein [Diadema antillarum]|uniref:uncharacterized protein n=1 Tax=Diadema antillarum TaxID=105358 RepID=UPI003A8A847B